MNEEIITCKSEFYLNYMWKLTVYNYSSYVDVSKKQSNNQFTLYKWTMSNAGHSLFSPQ